MQFDYSGYVCVCDVINPIHQVVYEFDEPLPYRPDLLK